MIPAKGETIGGTLETAEGSRHFPSKGQKEIPKPQYTSGVQLLDILKEIVESARADYAEARFHHRESSYIRVSAGELEDANSTILSGVGFRALVSGAWGFSSTNKKEKKSLLSAMNDAVKEAKVASRTKKEKIGGLAEARLAKGLFRPKANDPLEDHSLEEKMKLVRETEKRARGYSREIKSAVCSYGELLDHKIMVSTDGAEVETYDSKPEFLVMAVSGRDEDKMSYAEASGVTGGWKDLFRRKTPEMMAERAADMAMRLIRAKHPKGERAEVILDPGLVGLISHEAIGHTVEADLVLSGSVARGMLGKKVASDLVTLVDEGLPSRDEHAAGLLFVDDEGVPTKRTVIIDKGLMNSYLLDRETARIFGLKPTGNARAYEYTDEPIVRMTNTYIEPGDMKLEEMIADVERGYLLKGAGNGEADANAEFMFEVNEAYRIEKGEVGELLRGVTISGMAYDVLKSVDAISKDFKFDMGAGYCGKKQPAKVDGGGGYLRCKAIIGGTQEVG